MQHTLLKTSLLEAPPVDTQTIYFGMGCFWGAERKFWSLEGILRTSVGYAGGSTDNPDYHSVCSGTTGHAEVVEVVYYPEQLNVEQLLKTFWESHDPTQGDRQGNDRGSQYRSIIITTNDQQLQAAQQSLSAFQTALTEQGFTSITTEVTGEQPYYLAEAYHQQYLDKNPQGYCGLGGTGVCY
jgi:peptide-methionine (S)-S-oxide reductase